MTELLMAAMPPDLSTAVIVTLLATSFAASLMTVSMGIGGGALMLAVMASLMPPVALIPVHGLVQLGSNVGRAAMFARLTHWPAVPWFAVGSVVGVAVGGGIAVNLSPSLVLIGVGLFVAWSVLAKPPAWLKRWPWLTGGVSSVLTMFFGASGVFVAGYSKSLGLDRHGFVATHAMLMTIQHSLKSVAFGALGFVFAPWAGLTAGLILAGFAGTYIGRLILRRLTDKRFGQVLDVVLLLMALRLVYGGVALELGWSDPK